MRISVVIPFYNLESYVWPCLDSVIAAFNHQPVSLEVICVDDGSTDDTGRLLDSYVSSLVPRPSSLSLKIIHKPNGGEGSARNAGLQTATGDWITFLDGDDVWLDAMLTEFVSTQARHPEADIIGFRFIPFEDGAAVPCLPPVTVPATEFATKETIPAAAVLELGVFPTFFRREDFSSLSFSALPLGADRLYVAECLARSNRLVMSPLAVHGYRVREGSMARAQWNERKIRSMIDFAAGSLKALKASGKRLDPDGVHYLWDVLLQVTPKQLRRMQEDSAEIRRYWLDALAKTEAVGLSPRQRVRRFIYLHGRQ